MNKAQLRKYLIKVYELLIEHFNEEELEELCFFIGEDYESLKGSSKKAKVRELVHLCHRKSLIPQLKNEVIKQRPNVSWPDVPQSSSSPSPPTEQDMVVPELSLKRTIGEWLKNVPVWLGVFVFIALIILITQIDWSFFSGTPEPTDVAEVEPTDEPTTTPTPTVTKEATMTPTVQASDTPQPPAPTHTLPPPTATTGPNIPLANASLHDTWARPADGVTMVFVPSGTFTMGMNVLERTREIGVMRAIGAVDLEIIKSVVVEGVMIGLISWCIAVGLSFPISVGLLRIVSQAIIGAEMPLSLTPLGFGIWLLVVLLLSVAASILPARSAARLTIREVLAYE